MRSMASYGEGVKVLLALIFFAASIQIWKPVSEVHCTRGVWRYVNESADKPFEEHSGKEAAEVEADAFEPSIDYSEAAAEVVTSMNNDSKDEYVITEMSAASITPTSAELDVFCSEYGFRITAALDSLKDVRVLGPTNLLSIMDAPQECGYLMPLLNTAIIQFSGCHVKLHNAQYTVQLLYINMLGQMDMVTASCTENSYLVQQRSYKHTPQFLLPPAKPPAATHPVTTIPSNSKNCTIPKEQRLTCGPIGISPSDCLKMGCCADSGYTKCYYPLDVCTRDKQFVFTIHHDSTSVPVDTSKLEIPGNPRCKPVIYNEKFAIFKFSVAECGTRFYVVGETMIYLAEVQTVFFSLSLKYGVITRSNPVRFLIECRYPKSHSGGQSLVSVGYLVKIQSFPSVVAPGRYGVELLIAEDATYSKYLPSYHQPLWKILGKPVYLELRVRSAITTAVLLINYCLAYPRSASNAIVLVYEGCANPFDPNVSVLQVIGEPSNQYRRRFIVEAFQFMDLQTKKYIDEEIYFMCSTDVCMPKERECVQRCFDGKVNGRTSVPPVLPQI